jgi:hypothetical protein
MNMANRNDSEVRQHETLPGPGPGAKALPPGVRPVEQMVDAAIERIAREHGLSRIDTFDTSIATPMTESGRERPTRLNWKGLDVSDEFRAYAERVARGEDLPPFEGRVLAEPNPAFPWGPGAPTASAAGRAGRTARDGRTGRAALWTSAVAVLGLLGWTVAMKLEAANVSSAELAAASAESELLGAANASADSEPVAAVSEPERHAAASVEGAPGALPPDVVAEPATLEADPVPVTTSLVEPAVGNAQPATPPPAPAASAEPALHASVAPAPSVEAAAQPVAAAALPVAASAGLAAATQPVPSAPVAKAAPSAPLQAPERAASEKPLVDEFGIMVDSPSSGPAQAKSVMGSVGDLSRAGQGSGGNVRKEPGGESSAKGSLLVETPSF